MNDYWLGDGRTWLTGEQITIADYFAASVVALGDLIRVDFSAYPNVSAWLERTKALPNWGSVSEALDGFAASLIEKEFVSA
jgi:glutathione S-transferase